MSALPLRRLSFALTGMLMPFALLAQPVITDEHLFTERRGATSLFASSHTFVVGASAITPSGAGTSVFARHMPSGSGPDYTVPFGPSPLEPHQYSHRVPYAGQTGRWQIEATNAGGTSTRLTHVLDDVRDLPLITGLTVSGSALAPHLSWNAVDPTMFPSFCAGPCAPGSDIFRYQVVVRLVTGAPGNAAPLAFRSSNMPTSGPTVFDLPAGVLNAGDDYLIGVRLNHNEFETLAGGGLFSSVENRSTAYVEYAVAIPEPETYALMLAGLGLLGFAARRRQRLLAE